MGSGVLDCYDKQKLSMRVHKTRMNIRIVENSDVARKERSNPFNANRLRT
jgi:hypothetical protein